VGEDHHWVAPIACYQGAEGTRGNGDPLAASPCATDKLSGPPETPVNLGGWMLSGTGCLTYPATDNGSAFIDGSTHELLDRWDVFPLFSPPCTRQYNAGTHKPR
jgi:hypothetical protein